MSGHVRTWHIYSVTCGIRALVLGGETRAPEHNQSFLFFFFEDGKKTQWRGEKGKLKIGEERSEALPRAA